MPPIQARSSWSLVIAVLAASLLATPVEGQLAPLGPGVVTLTEARGGHTATLLPDDYVMIAGGFDGETELATVEVVDPIGMTVEELGSLSIARTEHTATPLPDGRVLIAGGRAGDVSLADAEILDPLSGQSEPAGSMNVARSGHDAVPLDDGRVLLVGGVNGDSPVASAEIFDPSTATFTEAAAPRSVRRGAVATPLSDGRVLLVGEVVRATQTRDDAKPATKKSKKSKKKTKKTKQGTSPSPIEIYDPLGDEWTLVPKAATDVSATTATRLADGRVVLAGGFEDGLPSGATWLFDPESAVLTVAGGLSRPRTDHSATLLPDGSVLILGGPIVTAVEVVDSGSLATGVVADTGTPRTDHTTTVLGDGRVLVAGGRFATLALDDLLVYDTADQSLMELGAALPPDVPDPVQPEPGALTRSEVRDAHGPPDAFAIFYHDELDADGAVQDTSLEQWDYYGEAVSYTFLDGRVLSESAIEPVEEQVEAAPYDPDQFRAYMGLDEVVAAARLEEYLGGAVDEAIDGSEIYFAEGLAWGMKDGELRYIEAPAVIPIAEVE